MNTLRKIKKRMRIMEISQSEMAQKIGVTEVTMSRWLNYSRRPTIDYVEAMAKVLDCEVGLVEKT